MKLVLLPGMDGTGRLFSPLLQEMKSFDCVVIPLPDQGPQSYPALVEWVSGRLPEEDFILVAESFSGPIGVSLAKKSLKNLKGVIFVASFLSAPRKSFLFTARMPPLRMLSSLPLSELFLKAFFLGSEINSEMVKLFKRVIRTVPSSVIQSRLKTMGALSYDQELIELPVGYIQASADRLVPPKKMAEFESSFNNLTVRVIEGPHFILQAKPVESAAAISELTCRIIDHSNK